MPRTFISIDANDKVQNSLKTVQQRLEKTDADLNLVDNEKIHMTLRFLGEVSENRVDMLREELDMLTKYDPFEIEVKGMGVFPEPSYIRVIWAGVSEGSEKLTEIKNDLESKLTARGFSADDKEFTPHFTIARVKSGKAKEKLNSIVEENSEEIWGNIEVDKVKLKKSELTSKGPIYTTLEEFEL